MMGDYDVYALNESTGEHEIDGRDLTESDAIDLCEALAAGFRRELGVSLTRHDNEWKDVRGRLYVSYRRNQSPGQLFDFTEKIVYETAFMESFPINPLRFQSTLDRDRDWWMTKIPIRFPIVDDAQWTIVALALLNRRMMGRFMFYQRRSRQLLDEKRALVNLLKRVIEASEGEGMNPSLYYEIVATVDPTRRTDE